MFFGKGLCSLCTTVSYSFGPHAFLCLSSCKQMLKVDAPRVTPATPSLPPHLPYQFDVLQSSHELLQHFKLFCDWAYRAFLSLKSKVSAVQ